MKKLMLIFLFVVSYLQMFSQVAVNNNGNAADPSAMLDIQSTTKGVLIPRMTATQRDAIGSPAQGLMIYVTDDSAFYYYTQNVWRKVGNGASAWTEKNGVIYTDSLHHIVIGSNTTSATFEVVTDSATGNYTSDYCTGGTASAEENYPGKPASNAFDDNNSTYWSNDGGLPVWLKYDFGSGNGKVITKYRLYYESSANYDSSPSYWTFQGSNDGTTWTTLDTQSGQGWNANQWQEYTFGNNTRYQMYRINITDNKGTGDDYVSIYEMEMSEQIYTDNPTLYVANNRVGIGTSTPRAPLDVNGTIKVGNILAGATPQAGMIRWNSTEQDFEGFNGNDWVSLTKYSEGWGETNSSFETYTVTASDGAASDYFGYRVSIDSNYVIVGAYGKDISGNTGQGKAYIFYWTGTTWTEQAQLTASDGAASDHFGCSVSISGDYAIIGAEYKDISGNSNQGKAYIFYRTGTTWTEQAQLTASDGTADDNFGCSVSISGDYAIIGADFKNVSGNSNQGKAYIFHRSGTTWTEQTQLTASDGAASDHFGYSVSIDGDYAIIGAEFKNVSGNTFQGKAYIFYRSGTSWTEQAGLTASDGAAYDYFGCSVSISGDYAGVGASRKDVSGNSNQGKVYIFHRSGTTWTEQDGLIATVGAADDYFGCSIAIDDDYAVIGAYGRDVFGNSDQGKAYIFHRSGTTWSEQAGLTSSDGATYDHFGTGVSINGDYVIVGAHLKDISGNSDQGKVYFFKHY